MPQNECGMSTRELDPHTYIPERENPMNCFEVATECRRFRDDLMFYKCLGKAIIQDFPEEVKCFYKQISSKIQNLSYKSLNELKSECLVFIQNQLIGISPNKVTALEKLINNYSSSSTNSSNNTYIDEKRIPEYDNFTEPASDCLAGICQEACRALLSINFESSKAENRVVSIINTVYKHGQTTGDKISSKYSKAGDDDNFIYNYTAAVLTEKSFTPPITTTTSISTASSLRNSKQKNVTILPAQRSGKGYKSQDEGSLSQHKSKRGKQTVQDDSDADDMDSEADGNDDDDDSDDYDDDEEFKLKNQTTAPSLKHKNIKTKKRKLSNSSSSTSPSVDPKRVKPVKAAATAAVAVLSVDTNKKARLLTLQHPQLQQQVLPMGSQKVTSTSALSSLSRFRNTGTMDETSTKTQQTPSQSLAKGVYSSTGGFKAEIMICGKKIPLGIFATLTLASRAHDLALMRALGPSRCNGDDLNVPVNEYSTVSLNQFQQFDENLKKSLFGTSWTGPKACDFGFLLPRK